MKPHGILLHGEELVAYDPEDGSPPHLFRVPLFRICDQYGIDIDYQAKLLASQGFDVKVDRIPSASGFPRLTRTLTVCDLLLWVAAAPVRPSRRAAEYAAWRTRIRNDLRLLLRDTFAAPLV